jgi:transposase-like protein
MVYGDHTIERDHQHLKGRTRPMRGFKTGRSARIVCRGHALIRNLRGGFYDVGLRATARQERLTAAWDDLTVLLAA